MANLINNIKKDRGFTIVELLVVIVVIGILAAITIVSYTGITAKANTTKALSNAQSVQNVAEVMAADNGNYPRLSTNFTTGSTTTKLPSGISLFYTGGTGNNATPSATNGTVTVWYQYCGAIAAPAAGAELGGRIRFWDFSTSALSTTIIYVGSGTVGDAPGTATCNTYVTPAS